MLLHTLKGVFFCVWVLSTLLDICLKNQHRNQLVPSKYSYFLFVQHCWSAQHTNLIQNYAALVKNTNNGHLMYNYAPSTLYLL